MNAAEPVRIGVVGVGGFGRLHALTLAALAEAKLVALVDHNKESLDRAWAAHAGVRAWSSLDDALRESDAEAWVIATRTDSHVPIARAILAAGKSVLIEKPLAPDVCAARTLEPLVAPESRNVMLGHLLLFAPEFRQLLREIRARGPLSYFNATRHRGTDHVTLYPDETPLRMTMVHDLYCAMVMTGGAEPSRMSARLLPQGARGADLALAEIEWPSGVCGSFAASFLAPPGMPREGFDRLEVFGDGWAARIALNPRPIEVWGERAEWPMNLDIVADESGVSGWLAEELRCFCRVVRGVEPVPVGARFDDALRLQGWLDRLEQSARNGGARGRSGYTSARLSDARIDHVPQHRCRRHPADGRRRRAGAILRRSPTRHGRPRATLRPTRRREAARRGAARVRRRRDRDLLMQLRGVQPRGAGAAVARGRRGDHQRSRFPRGRDAIFAADVPGDGEGVAIARGALDVRDLIPLLGPRTRMVSTSLVSFFNGFKLDLAPVIDAIGKHSPALLAVDVTQALGRIPLDLRGVDLVISSTHKWILGPHGGGIVGVRKDRARDLTTTAGGWFHLSDAFGANRFDRSAVVTKPGAASFAVGMPNFPAIYAIRAAMEYICAVGVEAIERAARPLTLACLDELKKLPIELLTPVDDPKAIAGILAFRHPEAEAIHERLRDRGVHVMSHAGRMRVAVHGYNTAGDVERFHRALHEAIHADEVERCDSHIHLFAGGYRGAGAFTARPGVAIDEAALYASLAAEHGIRSALVVGYAAEPWCAQNNAYLAQMAVAHAWVKPLAFVNLRAPFDASALERLRQQRFIGLSFYVFTDADASALASISDDVWSWLAARNWLISVNSRGPAWRGWLPILARHANLRLLISHLGLPPRVATSPSPNAARDALADVLTLARFPFVHVKLSGFYALSDPAHDYPHRAAWPYVEALVEAFGVGRLLWGSDFTPSLSDLAFPQTWGLFDCMPFLSDADRIRISGQSLLQILNEKRSNSASSKG